MILDILIENTQENTNPLKHLTMEMIRYDMRNTDESFSRDH